MTKQEHDKLQSIVNGKPWFAHKLLVEFLKTVDVVEEKKPGTRTKKQNDSIHLWLTWVAEELDRLGHTIQNVVAKIQRAEIRPTMLGLKEVMWRPYQIASVHKESTTQLSKAEVDKVYEGLNKFLGDNFEIHIPFPNDEQQGIRLSQHNNLSNENYPEYVEPTI